MQRGVNLIIRWNFKNIVMQLAVLLMGTFIYAKPAPEPDWFKNYRKTYPNSEYIAQRGSGTSAEDAKTDAASQLARYFQSSVTANLETAMTSITTGSEIQEETRIIDEVSVTSEVEFIGLEFTESYFYKPENKWYAVAYIVREDAWIQYKPKIDAARKQFNNFYKKAAAEEDPYTKISLLKNALDSSINYMEKLEYGRIILPQEEEKYESDLDLISEIPSVIETEMKKLTVTVQVSGDYGNIIETAVKNVLKKNGFIVAQNGNYIALVNVDSNITGQDPYAIYPAVQVTVESTAGKAVAAYESKITEKTVAYTVENAQKKAFPKLAEKINQEMKF